MSEASQEALLTVGLFLNKNPRAQVRQGQSEHEALKTAREETHQQLAEAREEVILIQEQMSFFSG